MFVAIDQLLPSNSAIAKHVLRLRGSADSLGAICDVRDVCDDKFYRLSQSKLKKWLGRKLERIAEKGGSHIADPRAKKMYAIGLLSEYLPDCVFSELIEDHGFVKTDIYPKKRKKAAWENQAVNGERGGDEVLAGPVTVDPAQVKKMRAKQKEKRKKEEEKKEKLKKAARGTKSILSFFGKKC